MPKKTLIALISGFAVILLAIVGLIVAAPAIGDSLSAQVVGTSAPTDDDVEFETNAAGETYGSAGVRGTVPDLLAAKADDGRLGFVRVSELELALNVATSTKKTREVEVYESDGETIVGLLTVDETMTSPRDGLN